ncbi:histidinol-phosphate transaminase [Actinoplanes missouriensis]|uniref:histidinol-phosphate transaminase n=1 Tax=Actinoplanes missouriensis TaxID=1866 RepID=UPI0033EF1CF6
MAHALRLRTDLDDLAVFRAVPPLAGITRLDSNELPYGPLESVRAVIAGSAERLNRYPDIGITALTDALAARYRVGADQVAIGPGSVGLCLQLVQISCGPGDEVIIPWRSFEVYPTLARTAGATVRTVPLTDYDHDLDAMAAALTERTRLIFLCTPNNPTGTVIDARRVAEFCRSVPADVLIVLDEAYWEFTGELDALDGVEFVKRQLAAGRRNVVALRTFSKAYGLAGLRVGYAIGAPEVIDMLRRVGLPYAVNSLAQAAAVASLSAGDELAERCRQVTAERDRIRTHLMKLHYDVPLSGANFVWLPLGADAARFKDHCAARNISVRAFPGEGVRVTVGDAAENDTLLDAAAAFQLS